MNAQTIDVEFELEAPRRRQKEGDPRHQAAPGGCIPRLARLMALAIKCRAMVERGEVRDYADLARLGHVTRARMSQIMNLVNLAPDIQEEILFLPKTEQGRAPITETTVRQIACQILWKLQRAQWRQIRQDRPETTSPLSH
jgi:hypothetical protein